VAVLTAYLDDMQALVGVFELPADLAAGAANAVICHSIDGDGNPSQTPVLPVGTCNHCTLCHVISAAALATSPTVVPPAFARHVSHQTAIAVSTHSSFDRAFSARAPPGAV
jgi:hypothetical protein